MSERFHLGDVLSITDGHLLSPDGIGGVYRILNYMTGDNLFTHQLPRADRECRPYLLEQHPQLRDVHLPKDVRGEEACRAWLQRKVIEFGEYLAVNPIPHYAHQHRDPLEEAAEMMGGADKVIPIITDEPAEA